MIVDRWYAGWAWINCGQRARTHPSETGVNTVSGHGLARLAPYGEMVGCGAANSDAGGIHMFDRISFDKTVDALSHS